MPAKAKNTNKNNGKAPIETEIVAGDQGPQLDDSAIGTPQWSSTMQETKKQVDDIQNGSNEQDSQQDDQPQSEEKSLTIGSGGYFQNKLQLFQDHMADYQARWTNALEEMESIMAEDVQDAETVTKVLRKRQSDRRKEWKRALDIDL